MNSSSGSKRKLLVDQEETTSRLFQKKPRPTVPTRKFSEIATDEDESDSNDFDEYTPGGKANKSSKTGGLSSGNKRKKASVTGKNIPRSRGQNRKMAPNEDVNDDASMSTPDPTYVTKGAHGRPLSREQLRKANHSMIERRRREKMNTAFSNLRGMVPGLNAEGEGIKGEFKLEVLEKTVEHMRYLITRISEFESRNSPSESPQIPCRRPYHQGHAISRPSSSAGSSDTSDLLPRSVAWQKRKADSGFDTDGGVHGGCTRRKSSSPLAKVAQVDATSYSRLRERSPNFATPHFPTSRLLASHPSSNINSLLASPAGSRTRSADFSGRDMTRSPFSRADSQATIEDSLPPHDSIHPSLQAPPSELVGTMASSKVLGQAENTSSAFGGLPSTFFRSAHQRIDQTSILLSQTASPRNEDVSFTSYTATKYRNPNLTLPPPVASKSPTSPYLDGSHGQASMTTAVGPSPFLPPILGTPALFDGVLPGHRDGRFSHNSISSLTSDINLLGKEEEAAANVLLALSSPEVMTPWQPASQVGQSLASLERWSLDQGVTTQHSTVTSERGGLSGDSSHESARHSHDANDRPSHKLVSRPEAVRYSSAPDLSVASAQPLPPSIVPPSATATSRMRKTAMDFLDMNRELPGSVVSMQFS
ncbi:hypothetical protein QFC22_003678 [Naganishia vaughanmartiniae]|uniref:Uncharacterized protein n=1 Tax=Naganishia vaughanmartiniae TaxID=1424756 RepID=A0ACC2X7Z1_9TREE|nr:hypothetical protein QFC22_003678 [Naganishia vaughanmartiniae]